MCKTSSPGCTSVQACPCIGPDQPGWTRFFGQTCGFMYRSCRPCPNLVGGGDTLISSAASDNNNAESTSVSSDESEGATSTKSSLSVLSTKSSWSSSVPAATSTLPMAGGSTTPGGIKMTEMGFGSWVVLIGLLGMSVIITLIVSVLGVP